MPPPLRKGGPASHQHQERLAALASCVQPEPSPKEQLEARHGGNRLSRIGEVKKKWPDNPFRMGGGLHAPYD